MYRHLLAATDGSELSNLAVDHAIDLAKNLGAKLTLLHVAGQYPPPMLVDGTVFPTLPQDEHDAAVAQQSQQILDPCVARAREIYPQEPKPGEDAWWYRAPETVRAHQEAGES